MLGGQRQSLTRRKSPLTDGNLQRRTDVKPLLVVVVLVLVSQPMFAADSPAAEPARGFQTGMLRGIYAGTFAVHAFDAHTSLRAIEAGAKEVDPLMRPLVSHPTLLVVANLARAAAVDVGLYSIARRHKIVAIAAGLAVNSAYLMIAEHNHRVARTMRAAR